MFYHFLKFTLPFYYTTDFSPATKEEIVPIDRSITRLTDLSTSQEHQDQFLVFGHRKRHAEPEPADAYFPHAAEKAH